MFAKALSRLGLWLSSRTEPPAQPAVWRAYHEARFRDDRYGQGKAWVDLHESTNDRLRANT